MARANLRAVIISLCDHIACLPCSVGRSHLYPFNLPTPFSWPQELFGICDYPPPRQLYSTRCGAHHMLNRIKNMHFRLLHTRCIISTDDVQFVEKPFTPPFLDVIRTARVLIKLTPFYRLHWSFQDIIPQRKWFSLYRWRMRWVENTGLIDWGRFVKRVKGLHAF